MNSLTFIKTSRDSLLKVILTILIKKSLYYCEYNCELSSNFLGSTRIGKLISQAINSLLSADWQNPIGHEYSLILVSLSTFNGKA